VRSGRTPVVPHPVVETCPEAAGVGRQHHAPDRTRAALVSGGSGWTVRTRGRHAAGGSCSGKTPPGQSASVTAGWSRRREEGSRHARVLWQTATSATRCRPVSGRVEGWTVIRSRASEGRTPAGSSGWRAWPRGFDGVHADVGPCEAQRGDTAGARAEVQHTDPRVAHRFSAELPHVRGIGLALQHVVELGTDGVGLSGGRARRMRGRAGRMRVHPPVDRSGARGAGSPPAHSLPPHWGAAHTHDTVCHYVGCIRRGT
jgi:hypothetical protein